MADHLASIYGSEKDKVNCSFYFKIGACRHGEKCSRKHIKPNFSQTMLMPNIYKNPAHIQPCSLSKKEIQEGFDLFYEDMYMELAKYGKIEEMTICDNVGDHLVGNVYVRYKYEADAGKACNTVNDRFYAGWPIYAELSPVTDFGESCCRQYENDNCNRGGFCNFMHLKKPSPKLLKELQFGQRASIKILKPDEQESEEEEEEEDDRNKRRREEPRREEPRREEPRRDDYRRDDRRDDYRRDDRRDDRRREDPVPRRDRY